MSLLAGVAIGLGMVAVVMVLLIISACVIAGDYDRGVEEDIRRMLEEKEV